MHLADGFVQSDLHYI